MTLAEIIISTTQRAKWNGIVNGFMNRHRHFPLNTPEIHQPSFLTPTSILRNLKASKSHSYTRTNQYLCILTKTLTKSTFLLQPFDFRSLHILKQLIINLWFIYSLKSYWKTNCNSRVHIKKTPKDIVKRFLFGAAHSFNVRSWEIRARMGVYRLQFLFY